MSTISFGLFWVEPFLSREKPCVFRFSFFWACSSFKWTAGFGHAILVFSDFPFSMSCGVEKDYRVAYLQCSVSFPFPLLRLPGEAYVDYQTVSFMISIFLHLHFSWFSCSLAWLNVVSSHVAARGFRRILLLSMYLTRISFARFKFLYLSPTSDKNRGTTSGTILHTCCIENYWRSCSNIFCIYVQCM